MQQDGRWPCWGTPLDTEFKVDETERAAFLKRLENMHQEATTSAFHATVSQSFHDKKNKQMVGTFTFYPLTGNAAVDEARRHHELERQWREFARSQMDGDDIYEDVPPLEWPPEFAQGPVYRGSRKGRKKARRRNAQRRERRVAAAERIMNEVD